MTAIIEVDADWLALREPEDARARSRGLALAAADLVGPGTIEIQDLGSGTGSMMRWLAPLLPGPQRWVLHDWNADLVGRAVNGPLPADRTGRAVEVDTRTTELARLDAAQLAGADLVTASALLDVLTGAEVAAVVDACLAVGCPVLLSLSVTGEVRLDPPDPFDDVIGAAFNAHQERTVDGRRLVGRSGAALAHERFRAIGWNVRTETTRWRLGADEPRLLGEWFDGWWGAALEQRPELAAEVAGFRAARAAQARRGALSAVIAHTDLLAWP